MATSTAGSHAQRVGLRIGASIGGGLVLILLLLAIARPEMMGMASVSRLMGIGWWPS